MNFKNKNAIFLLIESFKPTYTVYTVLLTERLKLVTVYL